MGLVVAALALVGPVSADSLFGFGGFDLPPTPAIPLGMRGPAWQAPLDPDVWATPAAALEACLVDVAALPPEFAAFTRYIWCPRASEAEHLAVAVALNSAVRRSPITLSPTVIADGHLIRVNLARLAPDAEDLARVALVWDSQAKTERYFHVRQRSEVDGAEVVEVVATPNLAEPMAILQEATQSAVPIVRADWFVDDSLSSINGGHYYDWHDVVPGETKLDDYLARYGADEQASFDRGSMERTAIAISGVTEHPRGVSVFRSDQPRPSLGSALIFITDDPVADGDNERRPSLAPFRDALFYHGDARESLVPDEAAWIDFALWQKQTADDGTVEYVAQAEAPNTVANDYNHPKSPRLYAGASCISCHGPDAGYHPLANDFLAMMSYRADVFDDLQSAESIDATVAKLAAMFGSDLLFPLQEARDAISGAVFLATGQSVPIAFGAVGKVVDGYHDPVTPRQACHELGIPVPAGDEPKDVIAAAFPFVPPDVTGVSPVDPGLALLMSGVAITRVDFEEIYPDLMLTLYPVLIAPAPSETETAQ